ncbi:MAG: tetratricopeptide repeat protein [Immundisolibacter sp.]|nr:tetratricopeptide repeat protein [Immundisolibacter sp.]
MIDHHRDAGPPRPAEPSPADPCFHLREGWHLTLPELPSPEAALRLMSHRILANPADLLSHVRRILVLIDSAEPAELTGALADLFMVLRDQGEALKRRLLRFAAARLTPQQWDLLERHLDGGLEPWSETAGALTGSLLSLGYGGVREVVRLLENHRPAAAPNALELARAHLEYGDLDAARDTLETALRTDPDDAEAAAALLEIYRHTRDNARLAAMYPRLLRALGESLDQWAGLEVVDVVDLGPAPAPTQARHA